MIYYNKNRKGIRNIMKIKSRMVNNIPMATIYQGMSLERYSRLNDLYNDSFFATLEALPDAKLTSAELTTLHEQKFAALMKRNAVKAGWYASKRKINKNNNKKGTVNV